MSGVGSSVASAQASARRFVDLWRLFRREKEDPEPFYTRLASESARTLEARIGPLEGRRILDLGAGAGYYADALRTAGAVVVPVDNDLSELSARGPLPEGAMVADAAALPMPDASFDGVFCSNLLEHTPRPEPVLSEIERVLRPGGWAYVSWTNWYSPWGGHDMTPYQFLGPKLGPELYVRRNGPPRKNAYGEGLYACHIGSVLRLVRAMPGLELERAEPRYWPRLRFILLLPGIREVATWNCVLWLRRV